MIYIKINDTLYPSTVSGKMIDREWDNRESKSITLEMDYATASALFVDGLVWSIFQRDEFVIEEPVYQFDENGNTVLDKNGEPIQIKVESRTEVQENEWDNSEYTLAGDIIDHRDGTITVKMGKLTELEEAYEMLLGGDK